MVIIPAELSIFPIRLVEKTLCGDFEDDVELNRLT